MMNDEQKNQTVTSSNRLLDRSPEKEYLEEWTTLMAKAVGAAVSSKETPLVVFRIYQELLALPVKIFVEIADRRKIHRIPHRSNSNLMGVVNLRGQLRLCLNLHNFLGLEPEFVNDRLVDIKNDYKLILAIQKDDDFWTVPVHEVFGILHINEKSLKNVPVTIIKSKANYLKGVVEWNYKSVGCLDEELLFYSLRRSLL